MDAPQLNVTEVLACVGPGGVVVPGLGLVGIAGATALNPTVATHPSVPVSKLIFHHV
jgi:hypothetical protein